MAKIPTIKGNDIYKKALKAYPPKIQELPSMYGNEKIDSNSYYRNIYQQGYEQALKDVKKDIETWFEHGGASDFFHFRNEPFKDGERCIWDFDSDGAAKCLINFIIKGFNENKD